MTQVNLIVALSYDMVIGKDNSLPWLNIPADMRRFKHLTEGWPVIMGRKTWESIPQKFRPLSNRHNIVLTSRTKPVGAQAFMTIDKTLKHLSHWDKVWIIGGGQVYKEALERDLVDVMHLTWVDGDWNGEVLFPKFDRKKWDMEHVGGALGRDGVPDVVYKEYRRKR